MCHRMIDGSDDKAGVGQRLHCVMVLAEPPAPAVRDDHQRQLFPRDRTILDALEAEVGADRKIAERHMRGLHRARIPDRARQRRIGLEQLNAGGVSGRAKTAECDGESPKRPAQRKPP